MKITFLGQTDSANVLTEYSHCLNIHSDIQSKSICLWPHGFNYHIQHDYDLHSCNTEQLIEATEWIRTSDIIIFSEEHIGIYDGITIQNSYTILNYVSDIIGFNIISSDIDLYIWHPGSNYRNRYQYYNNHLMRIRIKGHLYALDLFHLSPMSYNDIPLWPYQYNTFEYDSFIKNFKEKLKNKTKTILHIPSNSHTKGTTEINHVINKLQLSNHNYIYKTTSNISNSEVLLEKEKSLFYIDQYKPLIGGYGISALESLFRSNITFASINNISASISKLTNSDWLPIVNLGTNEMDLFNTIKLFTNEMNDNDLLSYMEDAGKWVELYNSPDSIIKYFKYIMNI